MATLFSGNVNVSLITEAMRRNMEHLNYVISTMNLHIGEYKMTSRAEDFGGWMVCDGRSLDQDTYSELFAVIGTSFGGGSGCGNTFNIPDARGRVMGFVDGCSAGLGLSVGEETHTLTAEEMPSHTHTGTTNAEGAHSHTTNAIGGQGAPGLAVADGTNTATDTDSTLGELNVVTTPVALVVGINGTHTHAFTTNSTGDGQSHNNMQPTVFGGHLLIFAGIDYQTEVVG